MGIFSSASKFVEKGAQGVGGFLERGGGAIGKQVGGILGKATGEATAGVFEGLEGILGPNVQVDPATARANLEQALGQLGGPSTALGQLAPISMGALAGQPEQVTLGGGSQFAGRQSQLADMLLAQSRGEGGPSLSEQMLKSQQDVNLRQQMALAASMGGRALPVAQRQIQQQQAMGAQEALQQAAILRAQEQQQAQAQLAGVLGTARGQDVSRQQLGLQAGLANQAATQEQARLQEERAQFTATQQLEQQRLDEQARQERERLEAGMTTEAVRQRAALEQAILTGQQQQQAQRQQMAGQVAGGILSGAGAAGAAAI